MASINFKMSEHWAVVKRLVQVFKSLEDGKYALIKIAYKPLIKIFKIPEEDS
jgi:hypothetical protein